LCAIYERSGSIPEKPRTVYRKTVRLLLEDWDEQRSVRRYSKYAAFDTDRKEEFLRAMAYHITATYGHVRFSHTKLERVYRAIHAKFKLPELDATKVMREVESHTGLIVEAAFEQYEFAHKSLQEYLTAEYLLKLPRLPTAQLYSMPNEVALAVAMSSDPNEYFSTIIDALISTIRPKDYLAFTEPFFRRLLIEKVDFEPSLALGVAFLAIYSETHGLIEKKLAMSSLRSFLYEPSVGESISRVIKQSRVTHSDKDSYRIVPDRTNTNFKDIHSLPAMLLNAYSVDKQLLAVAGR
jgi:hypothetical protein